MRILPNRLDKGFFQYQRHYAVIHLPEGAYGQKRQPHQNGTFVVQL